MVPCRYATPFSTMGGATEAIPGVALSAAWTWPVSAALAITTTGLPRPAGKWRARTSWPTIELGVPRNDCFSVRPSACRPKCAKSQRGQGKRGAYPDPAGSAADQPADPCPHSRGGWLD